MYRMSTIAARTLRSIIIRGKPYRLYPGGPEFKTELSFVRDIHDALQFSSRQIYSRNPAKRALQAGVVDEYLVYYGLEAMGAVRVFASGGSHSNENDEREHLTVEVYDKYGNLMGFTTKDGRVLHRIHIPVHKHNWIEPRDYYDGWFIQQRSQPALQD